jgi:hypothetical protein
LVLPHASLTKYNIPIDRLILKFESWKLETENVMLKFGKIIIDLQIAISMTVCRLGGVLMTDEHTYIRPDACLLCFKVKIIGFDLKLQTYYIYIFCTQQL